MNSICKIQRSQCSSDGVQRFLCYNEDRSIEELFEGPSTIADDLNALFDEEKWKCYFHTTIDKNGVLHIGDDAPWQDW